MKLKFTKMHGLGNDFVFVDGIGQRLPNLKKLAKFLCDRRFGIGADQLLILGRSKKANFKMEIYNADGGEVEMCGNGLRCLAVYVRAKGLGKLPLGQWPLSKKEVISIETKKGIQFARLLKNHQVQVDMGEPILSGPKIRSLRVAGEELHVTCVSMGNPHCVIFVDELESYPVTTLGPQLEHHHLFPERTNVEFVKVISTSRLQQRTWERGAGETLACGSGACAVAVAAHLNRLTGRDVEIQLKGGWLQVEWGKKDNHVLMTGPAELVYEGVIDV